MAVLRTQGLYDNAVVYTVYRYIKHSQCTDISSVHSIHINQASKVYRHIKYPTTQIHQSIIVGQACMSLTAKTQSGALTAGAGL